MTFAWYGHLRNLRGSPLWIAIAMSWMIAFFEYCFQVPANRIGSEYFSLPQLKVLQEIITMVVFAGFSVWYMKVPVTRNYIFAGMLLAGVAYLILVMRVTAKSVHVFSLSCLLTFMSSHFHVFSLKTGFD